MKNPILSILLVVLLSVQAANAELNVWISPDGNDMAAGTKEAPFATLNRAIVYLREIRSEEAAEETAVINAAAGTYYFDSVVKLDARDNHLIVKSSGDAVFSGGKPLRNWVPAGDVPGMPEIAKGHLWKCDMKGMVSHPIRQLWVGERKGKRASTFDDIALPRLIKVDKENKTLTIPALPYSFGKVDELEMTIIQDWVTNIMRIKKISPQGDFRWEMSFGEEESAIEFKRPWPILRADEASHTNHHFYLSNAIELLNRPHEWYYDSSEGMMYYWPAADEDLGSLEVVAPLLETIVEINGSLDNKTRDITFQGITFKNSTWFRPSQHGHVPLQGGQFIYDAYSDPNSKAGNVAWVGRPSAAVSVSNADGIKFAGCHFKHTGSTGLDFVQGVSNSTVEGCAFEQIGGSAILGGYFGDENFESHEAWNPDDLRLVCNGITIANNYIDHPAYEDWGCLGICMGFVSGLNIVHNEIYNTPYSAISVGWGWTKEMNCMHDNHILYNKISNFCTEMRDGAAIYTLSCQPSSSIIGNYVCNVGDPLRNPQMWDMRHAQFDLYTDEGTDYFTVKENWLERGEISRNQNGSHNTWGMNSNMVSESVRLAAGREPGYNEFQGSYKEYCPIDSIAEGRPDENIIDYIAPGEGFKLGHAIAVDINNDGLLDIAYSGGESFQAQHGGIRINKGDYGFVATQPLKRVFMGNFAAGDIDGDGYTDMVQAGWDFWTCYNAILYNNMRGFDSVELKGADSSPACAIADFNCDGLADLLFVGNGKANMFYFQQPDRSFAAPVSKLELPGGFSDPNVVCADFNNDGAVDIALLSNRSGGVYTGIFLNDGYGNFKEVKECGITPRGTRGAMDCADVNGDGFLDLVVGGMFYGEAWNSTSAEGGKTVTLYLGDGNGKFAEVQKFAEYMFDNTTHPVRFHDWNGDGYTDLIITGWNMTQGNISRTNVYLNDGSGNFTLDEITVLPGVSESSIELADMSGDGRPDILISGNCNGGYQGYGCDRRIAVICRNQSARSNSAPLAPGQLKSVVEEGDVVLSWQKASDEETPDASLTYNFYIKDLASGKFIVSPNSDISTGLRRISAHGNAWLNKSVKIHSLPAGQYAWSVQAVDASKAGGSFAYEQTFEIEQSSVADVRRDEDIIVSSDHLSVKITSMVDRKIDIVSADGRRVTSVMLRPGVTQSVSLPHGLYIIGRHKIIV